MRPPEGSAPLGMGGWAGAMWEQGLVIPAGTLIWFLWGEKPPEQRGVNQKWTGHEQIHITEK
jgi:hypothetical protein